MALTQPSWRLAFNSLSARKWRSTLLASAAVLATALVTAVSCVIASAQAAIDWNIRQFIGSADARIIHEANGRFSAELLEHVRGWPETQHALGQLSGSIVLLFADHRIDESGRIIRASARATGLDFKIAARVRPIQIAEGAWPQDPNEILLDPMTRDALGARVGDVLKVQYLGPPIELRVAGIYERKSLLVIQRPTVFVDIGVLQAVSGRADELSSIAIDLKEGVDARSFCAVHAVDVSPPLILEMAENARAGFDRSMNASRFTLVVSTLLTFLCAAFIIVTGMTTSVNEKMRELAMLRSIGAGRAHIFLSQLFTGGFFGVFGALIGVPFGLGLSALLLWFVRKEATLDLTLSSHGVALASVGSVAAGLLGAIQPALSASRVPPMQGIAHMARPARARGTVICLVLGVCLIVLQLSLYQIDETQLRFWTWAYVGLPAIHIAYFVLAVPTLAVVTHMIGLPLARVLRLPADMIVRSIRVAPLRNGFTSGALMVGISILVATWSGSIAITDRWLDRIQFADAFVYELTGINLEKQQAIRDLPFVEATCAIGYLPLNIVGERVFGIEEFVSSTVTCIGFNPDEFFRMNAIQWVQGEPSYAIARLKQGDAIIVAERFVIARSMGVGKRLALSAGRSQHEFEIVGVVDSAGLDIIVSLFGVRHAYMEQAISSVFMDFDAVKRHFDFHDVVAIQLDLIDNIEDEDAIDALAEVAPGVNFASGRWIRERIALVTNTAFALQTAVAFAALVLASIAVGNVLIANIQARCHEFGVLRAVGAHRWTLLRLILAEVWLMAVTAALVGTALGAHLNWVGINNTRDILGLPLEIVFPWVPASIGWGVLLLVASLAALPGALCVLKPRPAVLLSAGRNG